MRFCAAALALAVVSGGGIVRAETEAERLRREQRESQSEIRSAESSLARIEAELRSLRSAARTNQNKIKAAELELQKAVAELRIQQGKVTGARHEVKLLGDDISETTRNIERSRNLLATRARNLIRLSRMEKMEFLLRSSDAVDIELRSRLLSSVAAADVTLIKRTVEEKKRLEAMKAEKTTVLARLVEEERKLAVARNNVQQRKAAFERTQAALARQTADKEAARRNTQAMISRIKTQLAAIQERLRRISSQRAAPTRFTAPTAGDYFRPEGISLPGVYVRANPGTNVKTIAEGEVVSIQNMHGMGQTVIVGHGGNLTSVYANLASVNVTVGDNLSRGGVLARSGASPYGDAYYFAVYRNGAAQDPTTYLR